MPTVETRVVFVADRIFSHESSDIYSPTLEMVEERYFNDVFTALKNICSNVIHYNDPSELQDNIAKHKEDLVLSIWSGKGSRNRRSLVPAICESYSIRYVGADAYTSIVCQDKELSKKVLNEVGFAVPNGVRIASDSQLPLIQLLKLPLVVKPSMEGGSIGISQKNLVATADEAANLAKDLLTTYNNPILVEEFVPGKEVCVCILGRAEKITHCEAVELYYPDNEHFFETKLFSLEQKKVLKRKPKHRLINEAWTSDLMQKTRLLFGLLNKVEILRIDGKLNASGFKVIELTPDIHLGQRASFAMAFKLAGIPYESMLATILNNAVVRD